MGVERPYFPRKEDLIQAPPVILLSIRMVVKCPGECWTEYAALSSASRRISPLEPAAGAFIRYYPTGRCQ
jgi:hypothetical protein